MVDDEESSIIFLQGWVLLPEGKGFEDFGMSTLSEFLPFEFVATSRGCPDEHLLMFEGPCHRTRLKGFVVETLGLDSLRIGARYYCTS